MPIPITSTVKHPIPPSALWMLLATCLSSPALINAQRAPVEWTAHIASGAVAPSKPFVVAVHATIPYGWHLYSAKQPRGGPIPTTMEIGNANAFRMTGPIVAREPDIAFDTAIAIRSETYTDSVTFSVPVMTRDSRVRTLLLDVSYQACTVRYCTPPTATRLSIPIAAPPAAKLNRPSRP